MSRLQSSRGLVVGIAVVVFAMRATDVSSAPPAEPVATHERRFAEAIALDVETRAEKQMGAVRDHISERQWSQAIGRLQEIEENFDGRLVRLEPGWYVDVTTYVNLVLCGLPAEGLAVYRTRIDPQYGQRFARAKRERDEATLRQIVREAYVSSVADDALLLLGDLAFERGEFAVARAYWTQLVPLPGSYVAGTPRPRLRYPDADVSVPDVLARLVLLSLLTGEVERADDELGLLTERFRTASGPLGGRDGPYVETLRALLDARVAAEQDGPSAQSFVDRDATTFAGRGDRQFEFAAPVPVGGPAWDATLPASVLGLPVARPNLPYEGPPSTHPLVWRNVLLLAGEDRIEARRLDTGEAWPDVGDTPILYQTLKPAAVPNRPVVGVPRFTLTLDEGLLYARLGSAITGRAENELGDVESEIVCLDLAGAEGNLLARLTAEQLTGDRDWSFEGTPVVRDGRAYVALRRINPQTEIAVACLELEPTGRRDHRLRALWFSRVLGALEHVDENRNVVSHLLLAVAGERVFLSTDLGGIAALDRATGRTNWVVSYPSSPLESFEEASDPLLVGLLPPLVDGGLVFVAPNDTDELFAIDATSGAIRWRRTLPDRIRHLLGVGQGRLIASGNSLWALDTQTGRLVWAKRRFDPQGFGYGRGLLAGDQVWWPTREGVAVVHQRDGRAALGNPVPHWIDLRQRGLGGGNLLIADGRLVVAEPQRVTVLSQAATGSRHESSE